MPDTIPGPFHVYVAGVVVVVNTTCVDDVLQLSDDDTATLTVGVTVFCDTEILPVVEQLFPVLVTV